MVGELSDIEQFLGVGEFGEDRCILTVGLFEIFGSLDGPSLW